jgi:ribosome biogenesis GTPase / thiamine phosphate phosphatase
MIGRVTGIFGPRIEITADDHIVNSVMRGRMKHGSSGASLIAVGDYVEFVTNPKNQATVERILERKSCISRPSIDKEGLLQVIVSNIDRLVAVTSIANPIFKPGLIDRYLVIAFKEGISPVVVINKIDLADPSVIAIFTNAWKHIGCDVICTSAVTGQGIAELTAILEKGTSVISGHSGVGKSSILNRIKPGLQIKTARVSAYTNKGVHTTSRVTLFQLSPDGWVADTPGLKDLGLAGVTKRTLHRYFPEFASFQAYCQFEDCIHINEPKCGVKKAVEDSPQELAPFRYQSYLNIYKSLQN